MRNPTPKQALRTHITEMHTGAPKPPKRASESELVRWHSRAHHHYFTSHYHLGPNIGPDRRPAGWYSGEGAVLR